MRLGEELVGILLVDYREADHDYSEEEILLTTTLAQLGALVLERDRLLRGWAETRASELALEETKAQMDTFLGIASHELKTPLTSLKLSLQMSQRQLRKLTGGDTAPVTGAGDSGLHSAVEQLGRTAHQMERMESLVNDLVDVSRIQAGKLELRPEHIDLAAVVHEAVAVQQEAEPERDIRFQYLRDQPVPVYADGGRIEQVVTNYLTNALKYSPADGPVEVGLDVEPERARVWVRDYGPGLPASEQEHIWERFHRVQGVEVQSGAGVGLGLGLFISRMIVERHQGQVGVQSSQGKGATFWFTLPLSPLQ
jgi:signal transduction histidine kinase